MMETQKLTVLVGGMSCVRCAAAVENALKAQLGIVSVTVSFTTGKADIVCDQTVSLKKIHKAIKNAGYIVIEDKETFHRKELRQKS